LNRTHLISLAVNGFFILLRVLIFRSSLSRGTFIKFIIFAAPAGVIELFFERNSRPKYAGNELKSGGEDLEAKGLTEWMWDVLYWTWISTALVALFGDRLWWAMVSHAFQGKRIKRRKLICFAQIAVPFYSAWLAYTTFGNVRKSLGMGGPATPAEESAPATMSKRQQKMEKRGGQRMAYQ
jgi:hypothetical protein